MSIKQELMNAIGESKNIEDSKLKWIKQVVEAMGQNPSQFPSPIATLIKNMNINTWLTIEEIFINSKTDMPKLLQDLSQWYLSLNEGIASQSSDANDLILGILAYPEELAKIISETILSSHNKQSYFINMLKQFDLKNSPHMPDCGPWLPPEEDGIQ